ncbi:MAG: hypothetical protein JNL82_03865 [Myxococcales bacterium]|nr:hypothetical protein [Myxococcales bacterium]
MSFEAALERPGPLVVARDHAADIDGDLVLHAFSVAGPAVRLATATVPRARRLAALLEHRRRWRLADTYGYTGVVWQAGDHAFTVWTAEARVARVDRVTLELAEGLLAADSVTAVVAAVGDDYVARAVLVERRDGEPAIVASERDHVAEVDFTYTRNELLMSDAWWTGALARDLGAWLGVPWRDDVFGLAPPAEAFVAVLRELADRLARSPPRGSFPAIELPFTALAAPAAVRLTTDGANLRVVLRVARGRECVLVHGTAAELAFWLGTTDAPRELERTLRQLLTAP